LGPLKSCTREGTRSTHVEGIFRSVQVQRWYEYQRRHWTILVS